MVKWRSAQGLQALSTTSHFIVKKERLMSDSNSTAKFCNSCQCATERYSSGVCIPCNRRRAAQWRKDNPQKHRDQSAAWSAANPEKIKAKSAAYYVANSEKILTTTSVWRAANPEKAKATSAARYAARRSEFVSKRVEYYKQNADSVKASSKAWRKANPEAVRLHTQNHTARKRENGGVLSKGLSAKLFKLQKGLCPCCSQPLGDNYHMDHIIPLALGGLNTDDNIQLLRQRCNNQKRAKHPIDFMQQRGFLL